MKHRKIRRLILSFYLFVLAGTSLAQEICVTTPANFTPRWLYISYTDSLTEKKDSILLAPELNIAKELVLAAPGYVTLLLGSEAVELYIFQGVSVQVKFNPFEVVSLKKALAISNDFGINDYVDSITKNSLFPKYLQSRLAEKIPHDAFEGVLSDFRKYCDSVRKQYFGGSSEKVVNDFIKTDSVNWQYYSILTAIDYSKIFKYGDEDKFLDKQLKTQVSFVNDPLFLNAFFYRKSWNYIIRTLYDRKRLGHKKFTEEFVIDFLKENDIKGSLRQWIILSFLEFTLAYYHFEQLSNISLKDSLINALLSKLENKALYKKISDTYDRQRENFASKLPGKLAPDFTAMDLEDNIYTLESFRGKVVLVDLWASWCLPCIQEFPYLKTLQERLKDNSNFQLVLVSVDDFDNIEFSKAIRKYNPPGLHLLMQDFHKFRKEYSFGAIPFSFLIDKNGKFLKYDVERASEGDALYERISRCLKGLSG